MADPSAIQAFGITANVPAGWDGRIFKRAADESAGEIGLPCAQFSTVSIPESSGSFGAGCVELLGENDVFIALVEYTTDKGSTLFSHLDRMPPLREENFSPSVLQRTLMGQAGFQTFLTLGGRPFSLYVVLGSLRSASSALPRVNLILSSVEVGEKAD
jgi:hypothetical protein